MINRRRARLAIRARVSSLVVATTGTMTLEATAIGYKRATGSFVTDGFIVGQDVTPTGFPQTTFGVITAVTATELRIDGGRTVAAPAAARALVSGLPTQHALQNIATTPTAGRPYIVEAFADAGGRVQTIPGKSGRVAERFLSRWTWYVPSGIGTDALDAGVSALLNWMSPYTAMVMTDGNYVHVRGDEVPYAADVVNEGGWARRTVTIPLQGSTRNAVLA